MLPKAHVATMYIFLTIWQLKQKLNGPRAMICIYKNDLDTYIQVTIVKMRHQEAVELASQHLQQAFGKVTLYVVYVVHGQRVYVFFLDAN